MDRLRLGEQELLLLRALRSSVDRLADLVGLPRTNFGCALSGRLSDPLLRLVADRLVEARDSRYRLSDSGRRALAEHALAAGS